VPQTLDTDETDQMDNTPVVFLVRVIYEEFAVYFSQYGILEIAKE